MSVIRLSQAQSIPSNERGDNAGNDAPPTPHLIWPVKIPLITEKQVNPGAASVFGKISPH